MAGVDLSIGGAPIVEEALRQGVIINCTHEHILRLLPPLVVTAKDIALFLRKFESVLASIQNKTLKSRASAKSFSATR